MKKLYDTPVSEFIGFDMPDIITASDTVNEVSEFTVGHSGYEDNGDLSSVFNIQP